MQALGARFKIWADGAVTPIAEEIPELRALNETDLEDRDARMKILQDPTFAAFRRLCLRSRFKRNDDRCLPNQGLAGHDVSSGV